LPERYHVPAIVVLVSIFLALQYGDFLMYYFVQKYTCG